MTPEELDKLAALVKAATPGPWWIDAGGPDETCSLIGGNNREIAQFPFYAPHRNEANEDVVVALHNAAPALIAAARETDDLKRKLDDVMRRATGYEQECAEIDQVLGRALGYPLAPGSEVTVCTGEHTPASLAAEAAAAVERLRATVDAQTAIIVDLKAEKAGLELDVERLRAFVPVWRREDEHTLHLTLGPVALGGVMGPHPESGLWGAMATGDDGVTEHPDLPTAAAAVCARLGIPSVEVPDAE